MSVPDQTIMFLDDIEIHWPHRNDDAHVLSRWKSRMERMGEVVFLWSDEQMFDGYSEELRKEFEAIPGSRFFEVKDIPNYKPKSLQYNELADYVLGQKYPFINFND